VEGLLVNRLCFNNPHLQLKADAKSFPYTRVNLPDQFLDVVTRGVAAIDDEVGVNPGHFSASHRHSLHPGSLYEGAGRARGVAILSGNGILEDTSGAGKFQRLRFPPVFGEAGDSLSCCLRVALAQTEMCSQNHRAYGRKVAVAIGEANFFPGEPADFILPVQQINENEMVGK